MEILPDSTYARWRNFAVPAHLASPTQWLLAACGIEAGAVTHLVWDAFTHEGARGVRMIPMLDEPMLDFAGHHLIGSRLLQDVSSIVGLCIVLAFVAYALRPGRASSALPTRQLLPAERHAWLATYVLVALALAFAFLIIRRPHFMAGRSLAMVIANYAIAALRGFAAALVVVSLSLILRLRANR
jgi:hypothetical protein